MPRAITWAALALGLAVLVGSPCPGGDPKDKGKQDKQDKQAAKPKTVTLKATKDATVKLAKGDKLVLRLKSQSGTGYSWGVGKYDTEKLKQVGKSKTERPKRLLPGGPATQVLTFQAVAEGSVPLELRYRRPSDKTKKAAKKLTVTVEIE